MKKKIIKIRSKLFGAFLVSLFFLNHCKSDQRIVREIPKGIDFTIYTERASIPLHPEGTEDSAQMSLAVDLLYLSDPLQALVQTLLYEGTDPHAYKTRLIASYEQQYFEMRDTQKEYAELSLHWEYTETVSLDNPLPELLVISRNREYYLGGAHGMREKQYFILDRDEQKRCFLKDLLKADALPVLKQQIEGALRASSEIAPDEPLSQGGFFEDTVEIPENCFLTAEGLGFHWNQYEIAPYARGPIEVLIPYSAIKDILSEQLKDRIGF
jgi:hypothetical protein